MKLSSITIPAAALAASSGVLANEIEHPELTPFDKSQLSSDSFFDDFQAENNWKISHSKKDEEFTYVGKWNVEESYVNPAFRGDKGLVLKSPAAHHAISTRLPSTFDNTDNTLVLQYEVKLQKGLECGGAYVKLLSAEGFPTGEDGHEFNNETPYEVMFGPDKCGMTNKVHFIIRRKDPVSGEVEEKHLKSTPIARTTKTTNLYTLIIRPDNEFEIRVNGEVAKAGNLLTEKTFQPEFNPAAEIEDPDDSRPEDWDEREKIPDPEQPSKPQDWDESAPRMIEDPDAVKPEGWDEDAARYIPDPNAEKPEDWDDEEDGEWISPEIPNPVCDDAGCGPWKAPMIPNPAYKGKWVQPLIDNPNYKGKWSPRLIPNPAYFEDVNASNLAAIEGLGFELWTLQEDILFDNIYLGHSIEEAELIGNSTFIPKLEIEQEEAASSAPKADFEPESPPSDLGFDASGKLSQLFDFIINKANSFVNNGIFFYQDFKDAPFATATERPFETLYYFGIAIYSVIIATGIWGAIAYVFSSTAAAPVTSTTTTTATATTVETDGETTKIEEITEEIVEKAAASGVSTTEE